MENKTTTFIKIGRTIETMIHPEQFEMITSYINNYKTVYSVDDASGDVLILKDLLNAKLKKLNDHEVCRN